MVQTSLGHRLHRVLRQDHPHVGWDSQETAAAFDAIDALSPPQALHRFEQGADPQSAVHAHEQAGRGGAVGGEDRQGSQQGDIARCDQGVVVGGSCQQGIGADVAVPHRAQRLSLQLGCGGGKDHAVGKTDEHQFAEEGLVAADHQLGQGSAQCLLRRGIVRRSGVGGHQCVQRANDFGPLRAEAELELSFAAPLPHGFELRQRQRRQLRSRLSLENRPRSQVGRAAHQHHGDQHQRHEHHRQPGPQAAARANDTGFGRSRRGGHRYSTSHTASPCSMRRTWSGNRSGSSGLPTKSVKAGGAGPVHLVLAGVGGHRHHRHRPQPIGGPQFAQGLIAVLVGQADVHQDQVDPRQRVGILDDLEAGGLPFTGQTQETEHARHQHEVRDVVFDDEDGEVLDGDRHLPASSIGTGRGCKKRATWAGRVSTSIGFWM